MIRFIPQQLHPSCIRMNAMSEADDPVCEVTPGSAAVLITAVFLVVALSGFCLVSPVATAGCISAVKLGCIADAMKGYVLGGWLTDV